MKNNEQPHFVFGNQLMQVEKKEWKGEFTSPGERQQKQKLTKSK